MLKLLKRWLGWDSDSSPFDFSDLRLGLRSRPQPPPVHVQTKTPAKPGTPTAQPQPPTTKRNAAADPKKPKKERAPMDVLDNPRLTLDRPKDDGFDPYNTGAFNRSTSWEKIGRHKR
jgi:hypothetical protein